MHVKNSTVLTAKDLHPDVLSELGPGTLAGYNSITEEAATILVLEFCDLFLDGLTAITPAVAEILSQHRGLLLSLDGLKDIDAQVAEALSAFNGMLLLNGLEQLDTEVAEALGKHEGGLELNGITSLDEDVAQCFAKVYGHLPSLSLNGLDSIDPSVASILVNETKSDTDSHSTDSTKEVFNDLLTHRTLSLGGLQILSIELAEVLAHHKGMLILNGISNLEIAVAQKLAAFKGTLLALDGIERLDKDAELELRKIRGVLSLDSLAHDDLDNHNIQQDSDRRRSRFIYDSDDVEQVGLNKLDKEANDNLDSNDDH
jgi:hypothetical protein